MAAVIMHGRSGSALKKHRGAAKEHYEAAMHCDLPCNMEMT